MVGQGREPAGDESQDGIAGGDQAKTWEDLEGNTLLEEAKALALYVGRHGNGLFEENAGSGGKDDPCDALLAAIANATSSPSAASWTMPMDAYAKISSVTYEKRGVNGRSVLDTGQCWAVERLVPAVLDRGSSVRDRPRYALRAAPLFRWLRGDAHGGAEPFAHPSTLGGLGACTFLAEAPLEQAFRTGV